MARMKLSAPLKRARNLLKNLESKQLTKNFRADAAIELAALLLEAARRDESREERRVQKELAGMMNDPVGKPLTAALTDQCFRSNQNKRIASQLIYLLKLHGNLNFLSLPKRLGIKLLSSAGSEVGQWLTPFVKRELQKATKQVVIPGEPALLKAHILKRQAEGIRINLNHLGEAILGEEEANHRVEDYLRDLEKPEIEYVSVKISTLYSQLNLLSWEKTLNLLAKRLRLLYRTAQKNSFTRPDGTICPKFVNLDMEEYRDLRLTVALFQKVLEEPEFLNTSAGIVLQAYLPDSYQIQRELTSWALERCARGGAPIKIRLVKGANMAMEQVESALRGWELPLYKTKAEVDANFKRMLDYGADPERCSAVHIGVGSHNLFDIAYALILRQERNVTPFVSLEMLEGMAPALRRAVQKISHDMLLYCPAVEEKHFQNAVAYLVRRLDENTAPGNFLRHLFDLKPGNAVWKEQARAFKDSCLHETISYAPQRTQDRRQEPWSPAVDSPFINEPDTDFCLPQNRLWAEEIINRWERCPTEEIPAVVEGKELPPLPEKDLEGKDPSRPGFPLYRARLLDSQEIGQALDCAKEAGTKWAARSIQERSQLLAKVEQELRLARGELIGAMVADGGKTVFEADPEFSEAVDFVAYYRRHLELWEGHKDLSFAPQGTVLVATPWNFPCSIPVGGITAALAAGNAVLFKPALETLLIGWMLVQCFWRAGVPKELLQFIPCQDYPTASELVKDPRLDAIVLTGSTETAKLLLEMRPGLHLSAETGGKNAIIVTSMADRDLAVKEILHSAFGHAGQKCSACSLIILEKEVYDDPEFLRQLKDGASSLKVGSAWDLSTKVPPLCQGPSKGFLQAMRHLDPGESWLLEPQLDSKNPHLYSPGIKLGVKPGSFTQQTELFGPLLGVIRAEDLTHAIQIANSTPYGLTSGLQSLDEREQKIWMENIEAGNCYINRGITGAIVQRQPFGGCKESNFGEGAKAGGPNMLFQLAKINQLKDPETPEKITTPNWLKRIVEWFAIANPQQAEFFIKAAQNYLYFWENHFKIAHDPTRVLGQDNFFSYKPANGLVLRLRDDDSLYDIVRALSAAALVNCSLTLSFSKELHNKLFNISALFPNHSWNEESLDAFGRRITTGTVKRLRLLSEPSEELLNLASHYAVSLLRRPVLSNGRIELLNYVREVSLSVDYHRYGNLGFRENIHVPVRNWR